MTRRVLLATGATVVVAGGALTVAELTGRLDDAADAVGLDPKPLPDPADTAIIQRAAAGAVALLATIEATAALHPSLALADFETIGREHVDAVGGTPTPGDGAPPPPEPAAAVKALERAYDQASDARAADATEAFSADLVRVLASMSAGLAQCARAVRALR